MKRIGTTMAGLLLASAVHLHAAAVTWQNAVGVTVSGNSLTRGAAAAGWTAGASSVGVIRDGYGYVEFVVTETSTRRMCGLGFGDADVGYEDVDFGLYASQAASLHVFEGGVERGSFGAYASGDRLRVEVVHGTVRYLRNDVLLYTSTGRAQYPLRVDAALYDPGAVLGSVVAGNVAWSNLTGVRVTDGSLTKTGTAGWVSGAASANEITAGDGYVEFTAGENDTSRAAGLANGDTAFTLADIEFAIHLRADGLVSVVESGSSAGDFGGYVGTDRFRVEVRGGAVRYLKNDALFHTSVTAPIYPLRADTAFDTAGGTLQDVRVESLVWASVSGATAAGASLVKSGATGWNSSASSTSVIASGDGWLQTTARETDTRRVFGLEPGAAAASWSDIDHAIELSETGTVKVYESGNLRGTFGSYVNADLLRIEVHEGVVRYLLNGTLLYASAVAPSYPLHAEAALYTSGATLSEVTAGDLVWMGEIGLELRGHWLRKSAPTDWGNGGAVSTRAINTGFVEAVMTERNTTRLIGLSHGNEGASWTDIDFAMTPTNDGNLNIYESGLHRGTFGTYTHGDRLRVRVQSAVVDYLKNGVVIYTSTVTPTLPLRVDVSLGETGATLGAITLSGAAAVDTLAPPSFSPGTGTYTSAQSVTITAFPGADIRYTTNGAEPDGTSTLYTGPVAVSTLTTMKARAFKTGYTASASAAAAYSFTYGTLDAPNLAPVGGTSVTSAAVTMSAGFGTTIRFTTDGSEPTAASTVYSSPLNLTVTTTVNAKAFKVDWNPSPTASGVYTIKAATPTFDRASGTHAAGLPVTITLPTPGATATYTTDGSDPLPDSVPIASGDTLVVGNYTLKVRSFKTGCTASDIASATYTITGSLGPGRVTSGGNHSLAALPDGQVWTWGSNTAGELGVGTTSGGQYQPGFARGLTGVVELAAGDAFSLARRSDGRLYVWGRNTSSQLGLGDQNHRLVPVLSSLTNVSAIAAGSKHGLALLSNGTLWAWGDNTTGQLGDGTTFARPSPIQVAGITGSIVAVAAGAGHSVALTSDGRVWAWGVNTSYQVGDGTTTQRNSPVRVHGLFGIVAIGAGSGSSHSLAIRSGDGAVFAWGLNVSGQLGDGTTVVRAAPVRVLGLAQAVSVGTSRDISTAARSDGSLWAWGQASSVGDGSIEGLRKSPVLLDPAGILQASSANGESTGHSLALANDGVIWSWGYNSHGQIGDGAPYIRNRPVRVTDAGFAAKVATPQYSHGSGMWWSAIDVALGTATSGASIRYTTDATEPTTGSAPYSAPVTISQNTTLKAKAFKSGLAPSNTETTVYEIPVATPTFTPTGGTYTTPQNVTIATPTAGATIRYTTDGSVPTASSALYTAPLAVGEPTSFQAKAFLSTMGESAAASATYYFDFPTGGTPSFSPAPGTFVESVAVSLSGPGGATLRYTTDGSDPVATSASYASPIVLTASTTLKAKSFQTGQAPSATATGVYTVQLPAPTLAPAGGTLTPGQAVTLNHGAPGVTIRYTINGVDPAATDASATPGSTVHPTANLTLKARAFKDGVDASAVTSGTYTISGSAGAAGAIAAGNTHALVAKPDGTVWTWGLNSQGQLGDGTNTARHSPTLVSNLADITVLGGGVNHSVVRKSDGTPWTTGDNSSGQVGDGTGISRTAFTALSKPGGVDVVSVASGGYHTLALGSDGRVWAWGSNTSGQLGIGNNVNQNAPVLVSALTNVQAIAAGLSHSLAVTTAGEVWAWGANDDGQLGNGSTAQSNVPVRVTTVALANLGGAVDVAAGAYFSYARRSDGTVWSWGRNAEGQLGAGAFSANRTRADQVVSLTQVKDIAASDWHALAVRTDGSVWAWGMGEHGQLGNASGANQPSPVQAIGISNIDSVAAGGYFSLALGLDGSVWSWGANTQGQLGDGTTDPRSTPGKVSDAAFAWKVGKPRFDPPSAYLGSPQNVTLLCTTPGASIHYTVNGADPTPGDPAVTSGGTVLVDVSMTLKARAYKSGWDASAVTTISYSVELPPVVISHATGIYHVPIGVTLSHSVANTVIRFTLDGTEPTEASPAYITGQVIDVDESKEVKAKPYRSGLGGGGGGGGTAMGPSSSGLYSMKAGRPTHGLGSCGGCSFGVGIGVSSITPGSSVWGARGANRLGPSSPSVPSGGSFNLVGSSTLRTKAIRPGQWARSDPQSSSHFMSRGIASTPTHSVATSGSGGKYLSISSPSTGTIARYTLDGSEPTFSSSRYLGPIRVTDGMVFRSRAFGADWSRSAPTSSFVVGSGLPPNTAVEPTFDPPAGSYATTRVVTLTSATSGAVIHYTTTGAEPTIASPSVASGGTVTVTRGLPLKAIAVKAGMNSSRMSRADYRVTGMVVAGIHDSSNNIGSALALKTDGTVWGWGNNGHGELGTGVGGIQNAPVQVTGLSSIRAIALGMSHGLAARSDGTVWAWGQNDTGQLGDGTTTPRLTPAAVSGISQVKAVAAGVGSSYALTSTGVLYSWGINTYGQLGNAGAASQRETPAAVLTDVVAVAAGHWHVLALKSDGTVWAWGYNWHGQLGDESTANRADPVQVHGLTGVTDIAAGGHQSFAVKSDGLATGQAWSWGYNQNNSLGDTLGVDTSIPVHVLDDVRAISAGDGLSAFFVKADPTGRTSLWGSGSHNAGMLHPSAANATAHPAPVAVGSFVSVAPGGHFRTALRADTTLVNWGAWPAANGFTLGDSAWANTDHDDDGLPTSLEWDIGTDPWNADSNGDGIRDGSSGATPGGALQMDVDGDGLANELERSMGTDPFRVDTDGDGYSDSADAYPLDPTRWNAPPPVDGDTTPPFVTLTQPSNATLVSVVPAP